MSLSDDISVVIEETPIEAQATKSRISPWLILGVIVVVIAVIFGVRSVRGSKKQKGPEETPAENP